MLKYGWSIWVYNTFLNEDSDITVKYIDILISFWYSAVLYTSQMLEIIKNAENDIFSLISWSLMSIFSPKYRSSR